MNSKPTNPDPTRQAARREKIAKSIVAQKVRDLSASLYFGSVARVVFRISGFRLFLLLRVVYGGMLYSCGGQLRSRLDLDFERMLGLYRMASMASFWSVSKGREAGPFSAEAQRNDPG